MGKIRRQYTAEFKREAVALVTEQGYAVTAAARNFGVNPNLLHRWKANVQRHQAVAFPGQGHQRPDQTELRQLREENRRLRYVLETDVPASVMDALMVDARYRDLQAVERDFQTLKTTLLEVPPIFLRKATRTRGHVFVAMVALKIVREFRRSLVVACGRTQADPHTVNLEDALTALARPCLSHLQINDLTITRVPQPDELQARILSALNLQLPRTPIMRNP